MYCFKEKINISLTLFIFSYYIFYAPECNAQIGKNENLTPINQILFEKKMIITDSIVFYKSIENMVTKLTDSLKQELKKDNVPYASESIELMNIANVWKEQIIRDYVDDRITNFHLKKSDSLWTSYKTIEGDIIGDYTVINDKDKTYFKLSKKDSITKYGGGLFNYLEEKNINIKEYRNDKKNINDFNCFKVVLRISNQSDPEGNETYEMYVTESIDLKYHPIIRYKSILNNYYPMEIKISSVVIGGAETLYVYKK